MPRFHLAGPEQQNTFPAGKNQKHVIYSHIKTPSGWTESQRARWPPPHTGPVDLGGLALTTEPRTTCVPAPERDCPPPPASPQPHKPLVPQCPKPPAPRTPSPPAPQYPNLPVPQPPSPPEPSGPSPPAPQHPSPPVPQVLGQVHVALTAGPAGIWYLSTRSEAWLDLDTSQLWCFSWAFASFSAAAMGQPERL